MMLRPSFGGTSRTVLVTAALSLSLAVPLSCAPTTGPGDGGNDAGPVGDGDPYAGGDCGDDDPLTNGNWVGFCADRVDDNCKTEDETTPCPTSSSVHNYCNTG